MSNPSTRLRRLIVGTAVVLGTGAGAAGIASAASGGTTTSTVPTSGSTPPAGSVSAAAPTGSCGTALTGTELSDATAAATAAVPGATVVRAETGMGTVTYQVQMKKTDGTYVTVELDASYKVISVQTGVGMPSGGPPPFAGAAPTTTG
jgi:hypothetical protein